MMSKSAKKYSKAIQSLIVLCLSFVIAIFCCVGCDKGTNTPPAEDPSVNSGETETGTGDTTNTETNPGSGDEEQPGDGGEEEKESPVTPRSGSTISLANKTVEKIYKNYTRAAFAAAGDGTEMKDMLPLKLSWQSDPDAASYTVAISASSDMTDPVYTSGTVKKTNLDVDPGYLFVATKYYWQITTAKNDSTEAKSDIYDFYVAPTVRSVYIDGVSNTRDIGGYMTESGKRIRQGLVYRGANLDNITAQGRKEVLKYKFVTDLNLRADTEGKKNPLGLSAEHYIAINGGVYYLGSPVGIDIAGNKTKIVNEIKVFADESNYPVYFHCQIGKDRTGTLAFLLEALLGVSEEDIYMDYDFSFLSKDGYASDGTSSVNGKLKNTIDYIKNYSDGTLSENCEEFLIDAGVTTNQIAQIKSILLG